MVEDILLAAMFLGIGVFAVSVFWYILATLWLAFWPNRDGKMAKMYRARQSKPFDLRAHMGMK